MTMLAKHQGCVRNADFLQTVDSLVRTIDRDKTIGIRDPTTHINDASEFRQHKVSAIRRQLQLGRYKVQTRLTEILDKLFEDLVT